MTTFAQLQLTRPIVQAPMAGGPSSPQLVAAVSNAGGLGSFACGMISPQQMREGVSQIRSLTSKPFAMNLFVLPESVQPDAEALNASKKWLEPALRQVGLSMPTPAAWSQSFQAQFATLLELAPTVASFAFGILSAAQVAALKQRNILVVGTANSVEHLQAWAAIGADAIVVQGLEAGGHRGGPTELPLEQELNLDELLAACRPLTELPLLAAGGIMDAERIQALLAAGADAVQMGTVFLCSDESGASSVMKQALWQRRDQATRLTRLFSGKPARGVINAWMQQLAEYEGDTLGYPYHNALTSPLRTWANQANEPDYLALWAGTGLAHMQKASALHILDALYPVEVSESAS